MARLQGREQVRQKFLSTSNLRNYLRLFGDLSNQRVPPDQAPLLSRI